MVALIGVVLVLIPIGMGVFLLMGGRFHTRGGACLPVDQVQAAPEPRRAPEPGPEALPPKHSSGLLRQVSDKDIEWEIRSGRVFNAIRLYREQTGADAQEARSAVEAWRNRLTAS